MSKKATCQACQLVLVYTVFASIAVHAVLPCWRQIEGYTYLCALISHGFCFRPSDCADQKLVVSIMSQLPALATLQCRIRLLMFGLACLLSLGFTQNMPPGLHSPTDQW